MLNKNLSIIVTTSDKYVGLINLFFYYLMLNWSDHNTDVVIVGETINPSINHLNVKSLVVGSPATWSEQVFFGLKYVSTPYIILLMEDAFILSEVKSNSINSILDLFNSKDLDYLRLSSKGHGNFDSMLFAFDYKIDTVSICFGIWRRDFLRKLLRKNENAWEFEFNSLVRIKYFKNKIYKSNSKILDIPPGGVIVKGIINSNINYNNVFINPAVNFHWENLENLNNVTTDKTNLILRLIRIPPRYLKLIYNIFFNRFF